MRAEKPKKARLCFVGRVLSDVSCSEGLPSVLQDPCVSGPCLPNAINLLFSPLSRELLLNKEER